MSLSEADVEKIREHLRTRLERMRMLRGEKDLRPQVLLRAREVSKGNDENRLT